MQNKTVEDVLLDDTTERLQPIKDLWLESNNYPYPAPLNFFLDLIGYSVEEFGQNSTTLEQIQEKLGYHEIGLLGEALVIYSDRPAESLKLIEDLIEAEREEN